MSAGKPLVAHILAVLPNQPVIADGAAETQFLSGYRQFVAGTAAGCAKSDGELTFKMVVSPREPHPAEGRDELARQRQDSRRSPSSPRSLSLAVLPRSTGFQPVPIGFSRVAEEGLCEPHEVIRRDVFGADVRRQVERGVGALHRGVGRFGLLAARHP